LDPFIFLVKWMGLTLYLPSYFSLYIKIILSKSITLYKVLLIEKKNNNSKDKSLKAYSL